MSLSKLALVGTGGKIYLDGILIAYIKTINIKVTGDFEDIESCGQFSDRLRIYRAVNVRVH